jgi:hypothetical protein
VVYSLVLDDMETGQAALLTARALAGMEVTANPRAEARKTLDEILARPFEPETRDTWGLSPEAIAEAERADAYFATVG